MDPNVIKKVSKFIEKRIKIREDGCHEWLGYYRSKKFPYMSIHVEGIRVSFTIQIFLMNLKNKTNLKFLSVDSTCGLETCCNSDHLILHSENIKRQWEQMLNECEIKDDGCILWKGRLDDKGYGIKNFPWMKTTLAHKISYILNKGSVPTDKNGKDLLICHKCINRNCISPIHLETGSNEKNSFIDRKRDGTLSKITEELAQKIKFSKRKIGDEGYDTVKNRSKKYKVSSSTVSSIDNYKTWGWLPDFYGNTHEEQHNEFREKSRKKRQDLSDKVWTENDYIELTEYVKNKEYNYTNDKNRGKIPGECWEHMDLNNKYASGKFKGFEKKLHILSCMAKSKKNPMEDEEVRHLCGNHRCCNPDHLIFGTSKQNSEDARYHGSFNLKLSFEKATEIRELAKTVSRRELSNKYGVTVGSIGRIINNKRWIV